MPGFYRPGEYDLGGFAVGIVPRSDLIDGTNIVSGDLLVGMPSSGLHSNGFSLVRKILANSRGAPSDLLEPTKIYVKDIQSLQSKYRIKGMAHITGGGLLENIPRILPKGLGALIEKKAWVPPPVFGWLRSEGNIDEAEMYRAFNMGIGMTLVLSPDEAEAVCAECPEYSIIGNIIEGRGVSIQ
jgi:phosphoribosylformylglycinamidine cyclo-ligase